LSEQLRDDKDVLKFSFTASHLLNQVSVFLAMNINSVNKIQSNNMNSNIFKLHLGPRDYIKNN